MPLIKLTKGAIDALPTPATDLVYWDLGLAGFGVKVTPKGRKVFIVLYRTGGAESKLRKYTIGPYGRVTLHQARWLLRRYSRPSSRDATQRPRSARPSSESWQTASRICCKLSSRNDCRRTVAPEKYQGCFAESLDSAGPARAFTRSRSVT